MGRKRDDFWQHVDEENKCIYCGHKIPGASRIKFHLAKIPGGGIQECKKVSDEVQCAAALALNSSNKRVKQSTTPNDLDENHMDSNLSTGSTRGKIEVDLLPTTDLVGYEFQRHIDKIWEWLMRDDEMSIMGVWGMGGVGKTALLKHIHNKLFNHRHHVIWITVSQNYSISQLQRAIAKAVDENISDEDDELKIAARLLRAFKKMNKYVVILDNVWCDISLEELGIPLTNNGIKIIVTSRLLDVCKTMGCKDNIVKVEPLSVILEEDFTLFLKSLGDDVILPDDKRKIARDLTCECGGLPLAVVTIARSMRGKADIREWRNNLSKLRSPEMDQDDMKRHVFSRLKSSFNHLEDRTMQDCLLCMVSYYDEFGPCKSRKLLIRNFVDEGLINGRQGFEAQLDEGHSILNKLINNSLLLEEYADGVGLHNLVWAMAINIGKESHGYVYKTKLPDEQEWREDIQRISLYIDDVIEIPSFVSHKCSKLTTFIMRDCTAKVIIPDKFFSNMPALKILDLSYNMGIEVLQESISDLECLTVLLLRWCGSLCHIPSLAKLRQLRRLDVSSTAITQVPLGFENLTNLRWVNLDGTVVMKAQYLERLQMLESFAATFVDKDEFNDCVQIVNARINSRLMRSYVLQLLEDANGGISTDDILDKIDSDKTVMIESAKHSALLLPIDINVLQIKGCSQWRSLCDVFTIQQSNSILHISTCRVKSSDELEYLLCSSDDCILCSSLQGLNELYLYELDSLSMICKENELASSILAFSYLTKLSICGCNGLKKLLTPVMSTRLRKLEQIEVTFCKSMEEIFSTGRSTIFHDYTYESRSLFYAETNEMVETINLPNLKLVSLMALPQLNSVCEGIIVCGSLKQFTIVDCPKLKYVPQTQPPFEILVKDKDGRRIQSSNAIPMVI